MESILSFLPSKIKEQLNYIPKTIQQNIEEVRVRINRPIEIITKEKTYYLPYIINTHDSEQLLNKISHHSLYTLEEELKRGFITVEGGHRIGLAGKVILENGQVKAIRQISSFNIRLAKEVVGIGDELVPYLFDKQWQHTMIIGPPQTGKTTLLRDIARIITTGVKEKNIPALKVGIVDERSEIAGCVNGIPQMTFGVRVDILDACPKAEGMMMMIRSMSPDVLVVDEIGRKEDSEAILEAMHAGIRLVMTTHGNSFADLKKRPTLQPILEQKVFDRFIELSRKNGPGTIANIKDKNGMEIVRKVSVRT
ncbi:stage III sporulation protein AA [Bacillus kwashiorkori]|uniref:stage III sporulation protein AA n=1 Tax=Bacillus kwashiorkori TaxID=1522318 RepID=UPI0007847569|nr:stage III sporulation protein AA [Bacillus kwashiorkori]